jgi:hypothetical protein
MMISKDISKSYYNRDSVDQMSELGSPPRVSAPPPKNIFSNPTQNIE